jgi:hypothetical protein
MKHTFDPSSRRTGLAAAAALAFSALSRPSAAQAQDATPSLMCCGNGPPDVAIYGLGIQVQLNLTTATAGSYEFKNQVTGREKPRWWWVFAVGDGIVFDQYIKLATGLSKPVTSYFPVPTPAGVATAYAVESGFKLVLTWPSGTTPIFYTRLINQNE